jgi:predicted Zn-ribbon and HTH transcriptional regulator
MSFVDKLRKYLSFSGGAKCLECGYYSEDPSEFKPKAGYWECPKCGSGKTNHGLLVTKDN